MAYVFLFGKFPFEGSSLFQLMVALNHGVVKFPEEVPLSPHCSGLIKQLLQVNPQKRIGWEEFFQHIFVKSTPEQYKLIYSDPIIPIKSEVEEKKEIHISGDETVVLELLNDAKEKVNTILETFHGMDVGSFTREIFDILWKVCKKIKPFIALFLSKEKAMIFDFNGEAEYKGVLLKVIDNSVAFDRRIQLTNDLILKIQAYPKFKSIMDPFIESYETIISNLLGYAQILNIMSKYDSAMSLFRYSIMLGNEATILETQQKDFPKASHKYLQSLLIIELILSENYQQDKTFLHKMDKNYKDYSFVDKNDELLFNNSEFKAKKTDIEAILQVKHLNLEKTKYLMGIRNELKAKYIQLNQKNYQEEDVYLSKYFY